MGAPKVDAFLTHLAVAGRVWASTQNQALGALLFLYRDVLGQEIGELGVVLRDHAFPKLLSARELS